jgi:hypothetical protein
MFLLICFMVCNATIAPLLVRMEDIYVSFTKTAGFSQRKFPSHDGLKGIFANTMGQAPQRHPNLGAQH